MRKTTLFLFTFLSIFLLVTSSSFATIRATALPKENNISTGQLITVPVEVDLSALPDALGSYTASLTWNPDVLQFVNYKPGTSKSFSAPVVNVKKAKTGKIIFAAANPQGAEGRVEILNVAFKVIGTKGSNAALRLNFTAMAAAHSFESLMPYLEATTTAVQNGLRIEEIPAKFDLLQNYPNPFNPTTLIKYQLPKGENVEISIYNSVGQEIQQLVNEKKPAGNYSISWNGTDNNGKIVPAGIYIYRMRAGDYVAIKKMLLVK
ncbi:MAG: T9SS type A sorting domain-containing protein [Actinobacteria bacterium]|nr:T9SS type A sorting domain-containing protein [Actinomycetota bacterium]